MAKKTLTANWVVANPRGIPEGIRIINGHGQEWYEGDDFERPAWMGDTGFQRLVNGRFIVTKEAG